MSVVLFATLGGAIFGYGIQGRSRCITIISLHGHLLGERELCVWCNRVLICFPYFRWISPARWQSQGRQDAPVVPFAKPGRTSRRHPMICKKRGTSALAQFINTNGTEIALGYLL